MKYIVFSFDDGRKDFFTNAVPILLKYGFRASAHVVTGFIDGSVPADSELLAKRGFLSIDECNQLKNNGFDISSHSNSHCNDFDDISLSFEKLKKWGIADENNHIGYSSPRSNLDSDLLNKLNYGLKCEYIRTGTRVKQRNMFSIFVYLIANYLKSKKSFVLFNRKYLINDISKLPELLPSVAIKNTTTPESIIYFLKNMDDENLVIFNFHSIVKSDVSDKWDFLETDFDRICSFIKDNKEFKVLTLKELKLL